MINEAPAQVCLEDPFQIKGTKARSIMLQHEDVRCGNLDCTDSLHHEVSFQTETQKHLLFKSRTSPCVQGYLGPRILLDTYRKIKRETGLNNSKKIQKIKKLVCIHSISCPSANKHLCWAGNWHHFSCVPPPYSTNRGSTFTWCWHQISRHIPRGTTPRSKTPSVGQYVDIQRSPCVLELVSVKLVSVDHLIDTYRAPKFGSTGRWAGDSRVIDWLVKVIPFQANHEVWPTRIYCIIQKKRCSPYFEAYTFW